MMVHSTSTVQPQSIRMLLTLSKLLDFDIWTSDERQAYLQSSESLTPDIFIRKPVPEFELEQSQDLQLLKPLYGFCKSGDLWHATLGRDHRLDLGMTLVRSDPVFYLSMVKGVLNGLSGGYAYDLMRTGNQEFRELSKKSNEEFYVAEEQSLPCSFTGISLSQNDNGSLLQDRHEYLRNLETLLTKASPIDFRSMQMKLERFANTCPDCLLNVSQLAQVMEEMYERSRRECICRLTKAVSFAVNNRVSLRIPKLDKSSLRIICYSDSSFANNVDLSSKLEHMCFLGDASNSVVLIFFKSYKLRRVKTSAMAGEVIASSDLFDAASTLGSELKLMLGQKIALQLLTNRKSLFCVISKGSQTSEKRMMLKISAAKEGFKSGFLSDYGLVRSSHNVADGLAKAMHQKVYSMFYALDF